MVFLVVLVGLAYPLKSGAPKQLAQIGAELESGAGALEPSGWNTLPQEMKVKVMGSGLHNADDWVTPEPAYACDRLRVSPKPTHVRSLL